MGRGTEVPRTPRTDGEMAIVDIDDLDGDGESQLLYAEAYSAAGRFLDGQYHDDYLRRGQGPPDVPSLVLGTVRIAPADPRAAIVLGAVRKATEDRQRWFVG